MNDCSFKISKFLASVLSASLLKTIFWNKSQPELYENIVILPTENGRSSFILARKDHAIKRREHTNHGSYQLQDKDPPTKIKEQQDHR